jgi:DNA-binding transcriptional LysR family regulator
LAKYGFSHPFLNGSRITKEISMKLRWDDLKLFVAVHEQGSLSAAARVLKLGQPTLSRRIAELEEAIGETLFERKSLGTVLTAAGSKLLPAAQSMAEWANEAELQVQKQTYLPQGTVRVAAPPGIAREVLVPVAARIRQQHPHIFLEVLSSIELLNLGRGEADVALRTQRPTDADLVCVQEMSTPMRVYAADSYAKQIPAHPKLADLRWICWAAPYHDLRVNQELHALIPDFQPVFTSDDFLVQLSACEAGMGAMVLPQSLYRYACLHRNPGLRELDIDLGPSAQGGLYVVCHKRHRQLPKVQLVIDYLSEAFESFRR